MGKSAGPERRWRVIAPGVYRVEWDDGTRWLLEATPDGKTPWQLRSTGDLAERAGIGPPLLADAQRMAEFWLMFRAHLIRVSRERGLDDTVSAHGDRTR